MYLIILTKIDKVNARTIARRATVLVNLREKKVGANESISEDENDGKAVNASSDLCPNQFPLLHKCSVHSNFMDKLLQELVKYNGRNSIEYVQWNN
jgi:hypothetical protein